jgi:putative DNA primase/helicase
LQQLCGYALTGDTSLHVAVFIYGHGKNGKSVFNNTVTGLLGGYAVTAPMETFTASKSDRHPTELARMRGARYVAASETQEGQALSEVRLKHLTGGDPITARFMRQDFFTYKPQHKIFMFGNHKPVLKNVDAAIRRRLLIIPFVRQPANPDLQLEAKLREEWPGILRWMIQGYLDLRRNGLVIPCSQKIDPTLLALRLRI